MRKPATSPTVLWILALLLLCNCLLAFIANDFRERLRNSDEAILSLSKIQLEMLERELKGALDKKSDYRL